MTFKTFALVAATVAATASAASANTYFAAQESVADNTTVISFDLVTADTAGVLEVYELRRGEQGVLLGSTQLNAGANSDVRVNVGNTTANEVVAVVKIDGQVVLTNDFDVR